MGRKGWTAQNISHSVIFKVLSKHWPLPLSVFISHPFTQPFPPLTGYKDAMYISGLQITAIEMLCRCNAVLCCFTCLTGAVLFCSTAQHSSLKATVTQSRLLHWWGKLVCMRASTVSHANAGVICVRGQPCIMAKASDTFTEKNAAPLVYFEQRISRGQNSIALCYIP